MRNIIDLDGTEYLLHTYQCAQAYKNYLKESGASDILGREPELTGKESTAERYQKMRIQSEKNTDDMMKQLFVEKADLTMTILPLFVVLDDGEQKPSAKILAAAMSRALRDADFMNFFQSLM